LPKQMLTLNSFRGINTYKDPRDIGNDELSGCQNIMCDQDGAIRSIGAEATHGDVPANVAVLTAGHGLFYFASDHKKDVTATITATFNDADPAFSSVSKPANGSFISDGFVVGMVIAISGASNSGNNGYFTILIVETDKLTITQKAEFTDESGTADVVIKGVDDSGEDWLAMVDATNAEVDLYDKTSDSWSATAINMESVASGNGTAGVEGVFYFVDEALRVSDGNFGDLNRTKWYGYIKRTHFQGAGGSRDTYTGWFENTNTLDAPTELVIHASDYPSAGTGFQIKVDDATTGGDWLNKTYQIASSFIYDGAQESLLYVPTSNNTFSPDDGDKLDLDVRATSAFDERISGARIYVREDSTDEPWTLLLDISMRDGARAKPDGDYTAWASSTAVRVYSNTVMSASPNIETYEILNGFSNDEASISIGGAAEGYKTAIVANRRVFVANVRTKNKFGEVIHMGDRIMYSPANRFDTFPRSYFIDVIRGDAEEYVKLEEYADRLFAFKQRTLFIINISSPSPGNWFLEATHKYMGVKLPSAVFKTEFGIVWINESGCYLFDGSNIVNLIDGKIRDSDTKANLGLYNETWSEFITDSSMVGYLPKDKQIVVLRDSSASSDGDVYIYDVRTKSWTYGDAIFTDDKIQTNFIIDYNKDLVCAHTSGTGTVVKYNNNSSEVGNIEIVTKDIDFGDVGRIKKVYKVYTTYKKTDSGNEADDMYWAIDGNTSFSNSGLTGTWTGGTSNWDVAVHSFATPKECQSIRFKLDPATDAKMFFNDISIEYRPIYKRVS